MELQYSSSICLIIGALLVIGASFLIVSSYLIVVVIEAFNTHENDGQKYTNLSSMKSLVLMINILVFLMVLKIVWDIASTNIGLSSNPILLLFDFLKFDNYLRLKVASYWIVLLLIGVPMAQKKTISKLSCIIRRKHFHFLAVLMFIPPLIIYQSSLLVPFYSLAYSVALALLLYVEALRCYIIPSHPLCKYITASFSPFLDSRCVLIFIYTIYTPPVLSTFYFCYFMAITIEMEIVSKLCYRIYICFLLVPSLYGHMPYSLSSVVQHRY